VKRPSALPLSRTRGGCRGTVRATKRGRMARTGRAAFQRAGTFKCPSSMCS